MPTIHRARGMRFVIYLDDHLPAHVHVLATDGDARIDLGIGRAGPTLLGSEHLDRSTLRKAMAEVIDHRERMIAAWRRLHGGTEI